MAPSPTRFTLSREKHSETGIDYLYDNEDSVCGLIHDNTPYYFKKNLQGDVIQIIDSAGTPVANYSYDAWGACTIESDTSDCEIATINPFRYRSYYQDNETGFFYLEHRYYCPEISRFLSIDSKFDGSRPGSFPSIFSYCRNAPTVYVDANGTSSMPFSELSYPGEIHYYVVLKVCKDGNEMGDGFFFPEVPIYSKRADIIRTRDTLPSEIYEVKPISYQKGYLTRRALNQLGMYINLAIRGKVDNKTEFVPGTYNFTGAFVVLRYFITYYTENGIIYYRFQMSDPDPSAVPEYDPADLKEKSYDRSKPKPKVTGDAPGLITEEFVTMVAACAGTLTMVFALNLQSETKTRTEYSCHVW